MVAAAAVLTKATALAAHGAVLAKGSVNTNQVTPGVLGFLVVAGMGLALFFLLRSMNRQFRKLPPPPEPDQADGASDGPAGDVAATGAVTGSDRRRS